MSASVLLEVSGQEYGQDSRLNLLDLLDGPTGGPSSLVLRGEPGTGKSALLEDLAARAPGHGLRVLRACGAETEAELPFSGVHQLLYPLREYIDRLPPTQREALHRAFGLADGPQPSRFVISAAALALVGAAASAEGPLLLLVDDVSGIDRASAEVLGFVARRLSGQPVLFVAAVTEADPVTLSAGLPELRVRPRRVDAPVAPARLRSVTPPPAPVPLTGPPAELTAQERRIAGLAAQGLTNKQIGEQLFLSHRTVGTHLYKIFPKLGITSRAALRDALARLGQ
ncbi:helix-turn-helix transcriptional regulator [Kineosporia sp. J2-2]|uniref:Helix-turn-helix transcriptional regulator n=1 Tax=Kineosporia corallincola TaxID=2835133 RepID=A0ABS5TR85_9ACTN|nr:AAA family ATPase [Kineosporia corallincola]MBT0772869.1 helix-turn-helix transcriptional regulator [Kineosporia corallincola]